MKWYKSDEYAPKHGSEIFVWDKTDQKEMYINFLGEWDFDNIRCYIKFPIWRYVHEGIDPIPKPNQPERSKREDLSIEYECSCRDCCDIHCIRCR